MARTLRSYPAPKLLSRCAVALAILLGGTAWAGDKLIQVDGQHRHDAVVITKVTYGNSEVDCGLVVSSTALQPVIPFQAGDDWLQDVTVYLLNRTDKMIVFAQTTLAFPETGDGSFQRPMRVYNVTLGRLPPNAAFSGRTGQPLPQNPNLQAIAFAPGEVLPVHLGDYINQIRTSADNVPFTALTKLTVRRSFFVFEDGMRWNGGAYSVPDPERPGKWKPLDAAYFPGTPVWPPGDHK